MVEPLEVLQEFRRHSDVFIYAIQAGEGGPVKIGTATDPRRRLATLQTASPVRLRGLAAWPGSPAEEKMWHEAFKDLRLEGEWFQPSDELLELVDFLGGHGCEFHRESDCLAAGPAWPLVGTCKACGTQFLDDFPAGELDLDPDSTPPCGGPCPPVGCMDRFCRVGATDDEDRP